MTFETVIIGDATLILGDCMDVLPTLGKVDACITDPPYGVMLGETLNGNSRTRQRGQYESFSDTKQYVEEVAVPALALCIKRYGRVIATVGQRNAWCYPPPDDIGCWFNPGGSSASKWGWLTSHIILYWGKDPRAGGRITANSITGFGPLASDRVIDHPCPKPLGFMEWMVEKGSLKDEIVLDPFMGSGTTGVAAIQLGRKFIGIERERKYFDIAVERITNAQRQSTLFEPQRAQQQSEIFATNSILPADTPAASDLGQPAHAGGL